MFIRDIIPTSLNKQSNNNYDNRNNNRNHNKNSNNDRFIDIALTLSEGGIGFLDSFDESRVFGVFCLLIGYLEDAICLASDGGSAVDHAQRVGLTNRSLRLGCREESGAN